MRMLGVKRKKKKDKGSKKQNALMQQSYVQSLTKSFYKTHNFVAKMPTNENNEAELSLDSQGKPVTNNKVPEGGQKKLVTKKLTAKLETTKHVSITVTKDLERTNSMPLEDNLASTPADFTQALVNRDSLLGATTMKTMMTAFNTALAYKGPADSEQEVSDSEDQKVIKEVRENSSSGSDDLTVSMNSFK